MLGNEFRLVLDRLNASRGVRCTFFAFAVTVATHSFSRHEEGHGWLGVRFQTGMQRLATSRDHHPCADAGP